MLAAKIHDTPGRCRLAVLGARHRLIAAQNGVDHCEHLATSATVTDMSASSAARCRSLRIRRAAGVGLAGACRQCLTRSASSTPGSRAATTPNVLAAQARAGAAGGHLCAGQRRGSDQALVPLLEQLPVVGRGAHLGGELAQVEAPGPWAFP